MSNNKTVIPGLEPSQGGDAGFSYSSAQQSFGKGTVIPGMSQGAGMSQQPGSSASGKPVVGFLYSISRTGAGEFWPLHIGPNSIGRTPGCDVCLSEATVSEQHAELVVRQMKNPEKIIASIYDQRSTCGTMINGESLGFEPRECVNGDIITIGEHYDLYIILIDAKQLGLNVCQAFMPVAGQQAAGPFGQPQMGSGATRPFNPTYGDAQPTPPPFQPGRTVGADPMPGNGGQRTEPGRTIFM